MSKVCFKQDEASLAGGHPVSRLASPLRETYHQEKISESENDLLKAPQNLHMYQHKSRKITYVFFFANYTFSFHLDTLLDIEDIPTILAGTL